MLNIELPYGPAIPLLGTYPKELKARTQADICIPMCRTALFKIAKRWEQTNIYQWIIWKNMRCIHWDIKWNRMLFSL